MENLIHEVNGIKYLLFKADLKSKQQATDFTDRIKSHKGIVQSYDVKESFWNGTTVSISVLIPEQVAYLFSNS